MGEDGRWPDSGPAARAAAAISFRSRAWMSGLRWSNQMLSLKTDLEGTALSMRRASADPLAVRRLERELETERRKSQGLDEELRQARARSAGFFEQAQAFKDAMLRDALGLTQKLEAERRLNCERQSQLASAVRGLEEARNLCRSLEEQNARELASWQERCRALEALAESLRCDLAALKEDLRRRREPPEPILAACLPPEAGPDPEARPGRLGRFWKWWQEPVFLTEGEKKC